MDITQLEGYKPEMTDAEKLALIQTYEPPKPDTTGFISKKMFDETASQLAETKRQLKAKMTEDELKEAERLANETAMQTKLAELEKKNKLTESKSRFLGLGYDEKLASETAQAFADGDMDKVFANQQIHIENIKKAERAAALAGDPKPPAGNAPSVGDFDKAIAEAQGRGDFVTVASLIRQKAEAEAKKK